MPIDMALYMKQRRLNRRAALIELAGGVCVRCGSTDRLEFDHRDRNTKLFDLSGCFLDKAWSKILEEFAKCDLLCHEHHRDKTVKCGEAGGGQNRIDDHGTEAMYCKGCKCDPCRVARYEARVRRGELKGTKGPYKTQSSLAQRQLQRAVNS